MPRLAALLVAATTLAASLLGCGVDAPSPNLVLVLSDSLRAANLPLYGYERGLSPALDELARESIVFEQHLANYPGTPFSVSQMFSGRLMSPLLMSFTPNRIPVRALDPELLVLPRELQQLGYRTGIVTAHPWFGPEARIRDFFESAVVVNQPGSAYAPFATLLPAIDRFLAAASDDPRPFFLYVHSMDTHSPMRLHEGFAASRDAIDQPSEIDKYDSEIAYTDHHVGLLLQRLRDADQLDDSIFVFTSDHGEEFGEAGRGWWHRGHGATLRRALLHVPLLMRLPGGAHAGRRTASSRHLDLAPTLLQLVEPNHPLGQFTLDGRDLGPELRGEVPATSPLSHSYNWLFSAAHERDRELHYDQWTQGFARYRVERDAHNYPALVPLPSAGDAESSALTTRILQAYEGFESLAKARPGGRQQLVGLPTHVEHEAGSAPTLRSSAKDGRWHLRSPTLLEAEAGESADAIVLSMPWIPGRYEVFIRLAQRQAKLGYENRLRVELLDGDGEAVEVDGRAAKPPYLISLGVHELSETLAVRFSEPRGGVAITGFALRPVDAPHAEGPPIDEALEEQLRSLGYVE